jgi:hypothetical protein
MSDNDDVGFCSFEVDFLSLRGVMAVFYRGSRVTTRRYVVPLPRWRQRNTLLS